MVNRLNTKPKSERTFKIDVREMYRDGLLQPGASSSKRSTLGGEILADISMTALEDKLIIHTKPDQHIALTRTNCHYGGCRYWFQCPRCKKRVAILYAIHSSFSCRTCHDVSYYSRCESKLDRLIRKKNKLRKRLSFDGMEDFGIYIKPKGMHRKTFDRQLDKFESINKQISQQMVNRFGIDWA